MSSIKDKKLPLKQLNKRIEDPQITELKLAAIDGDYDVADEKFGCRNSKNRIINLY